MSCSLRLYLQSAVLPSIPRDPRTPVLPLAGSSGARQDRRLTVRPERHRRLVSMRRIKRAWWDAEVQKFLDQSVPDLVVKNDMKENKNYNPARLSVPSPWVQVSDPDLLAVPDMGGLCSWIDNGPLRTAERLMHLIHPDTSDWVVDFESPRHDPDAELMSVRTWTSMCPPGCCCGKSRTAVVIAVLPSWIISPKELEDFVACNSFPQYQQGSKPRLQPKHRVWAKIWDQCYARQCHYFALATYDSWIFGNFSPCYTTAYVTRVKDHRAQQSTVVESLVYWFASALGKPGGWRRPTVWEAPLGAQPLQPPAPVQSRRLPPLSPLPSMPSLTFSASTASDPELEGLSLISPQRPPWVVDVISNSPPTFGTKTLVGSDRRHLVSASPRTYPAPQKVFHLRSSSPPSRTNSRSSHGSSIRCERELRRSRCSPLSYSSLSPAPRRESWPLTEEDHWSVRASVSKPGRRDDSSRPFPEWLLGTDHEGPPPLPQPDPSRLPPLCPNQDMDPHDPPTLPSFAQIVDWLGTVPVGAPAPERSPEESRSVWLPMPQTPLPSSTPVRPRSATIPAQAPMPDRPFTMHDDLASRESEDSSGTWLSRLKPLAPGPLPASTVAVASSSRTLFPLSRLIPSSWLASH